MKRIRNLFVAIVAIPIIAIAGAIGFDFFTLPNEEMAADAENLGQVFEAYQSRTPAALIPKSTAEYPALLSCASCIGFSSRGCPWMMASRVAMRVEGQEPQRMGAFHLKATLLTVAIWLRYDPEQIERLFVAAYTNQEGHQGVDAVCSGLFKKGCRELSSDEVIYLDAWIRGHDFMLNRLKSDPGELAKRREKIAASCKI